MLIFASVSVAADLPEQWLTDLESAKTAASEQQKPILTVFSAEWCGPCQHMVSNVYPEERVVAALNEYVPVYVDGDKHPEIAKSYEVKSFPTFVLLDTAAEETSRFVGGASNADHFLQRLDEAEEQGTAIEALREKIAANPSDADAHAALGKLYQANRQTERAVQHLAAAATTRPELLAELGNPIRAQVEAEVQYRREVAALDEQLAATPDDPALLKARGDLRTANNAVDEHPERFEKGLADYKRAAQLDAENKTGAAAEVAFYDLLLSEAGPPEEMLAELSAFMDSHPNTRHMGELLFMRGATYVQAGEAQKARADLERAIAEYPDSPYTRYAGMILRQLPAAE